MIAVDLIRLALRKIGALQTGGEVSASEGAEALSALRNLYKSLIVSGAFGSQQNVYVRADQDYTALPGDRIVTEDYATSTITLPLIINDRRDEWDYGWGPRFPYSEDGPPSDLALVTVNDHADPSKRFFYIYDDAVAQWIDIEAFQLANEAPLSIRLGDELASMLAIVLAPEYGADAMATAERPSVQAAARNGRVAITHRYGTRRRPAYGSYN